MNFNNPHPSDEIIDRELQALRQPASSVHGLGDAILAMKATPNKAKLNPWALRLGTVAVVAIGVVGVVSLTTPRAYAGELRAIANQMQSQTTKYMKAYLYGGHPKPELITELWTDHNNEKFLQYRDGKLEAATTADGTKSFRYFVGNAAMGMPPSASLDLDVSEHFTVDTIDSMLNSDFFRKHKIVKQTGVMLNGKAYDYYDFANGYYRMWVDPATKLPAQREVYGKGTILWERDVYEYPASFPANTFKAPEIPGVPYYDYPAARAKLQTELASNGSTRKVGDVTVTLKAIVHDQQSLVAFFTSDGEQGKVTDVRRMPLPGVRFFTENLRDEEIKIDKPHGLKNERMYLVAGSSLKNLETLKIGVWSRGQFAGYAEFPYKNVIEVPYMSNLIWRPVWQPAQTATAKDVSATK